MFGLAVSVPLIVAGEFVVDAVAIGGWLDARAFWPNWVAPIVCSGLVVDRAKWIEARRHAA